MRINFRILLLLVIFAMLAGLLAACAPAATPTVAPAEPTEAVEATTAPAAENPTDAPKSEPVKLTFWFNWEGANANIMKELVNRFNEQNPDIVVEPVFQPYADIMTLFQTSIAGGTAPDVAALDLILIPQLVETGAIAPLDDFVAADADLKVDDFYPMLANFDLMGGKRYALPVSTNNMQLIWNKNLFTKAGLDPEKAPATWEEMQAMAEKCQDPANGVVGFEYYTQPTGEGITWQFQVWLWAAGGCTST